MQSAGVEGQERPPGGADPSPGSGARVPPYAATESRPHRTALKSKTFASVGLTTAK